MRTILLATRNPGKVKEIIDLLAATPVVIHTLLDRPDLPEVVEDGATLEENALIKARTIFRLTGEPTVADDSGLEVEALGMRPGVYSARYAGENATYDDNNRKLLEELRDVPAERRGARFRCVASFAAPGIEHTEEGSCEGTIISAPRGEGGFGYDPLFVPVGDEKTFAELPIAIKNSMSHRSIAFRRMAQFLQEYLK